MRLFLFIGASALVLFTGLASGTAQAQVSVRDSSVLSKVSDVASNTAQQVNQLEDLRKLSDETVAAIGAYGRFSLAERYGSHWAPFEEGGAFLQELRDSAPNACEFVECSEGGDPGVSFESYQETRDFILDNLFDDNLETVEQEYAIRNRRNQAVRNAAIHAYAVSLLSREYSASLEERSSRLEAIVDSSDNLREEVRANSAVLLALYQQIGQLQAAQASQSGHTSASSITTGTRFNRTERAPSGE